MEFELLEKTPPTIQPLVDNKSDTNFEYTVLI
jgi:hypothetical protein